MNSLLPPGSSALERRLAQACSGISDLNVPLRVPVEPVEMPGKVPALSGLGFFCGPLGGELDGRCKAAGCQ